MSAERVRIEPSESSSAAAPALEARPAHGLAHAAGGAGGVLAVSLLGLALVFGTHLVLTRALGARDYGALAYALTWAEVLGMLAPLGFDKLMIRELAALAHAGDWARARALRACAARWTAGGVGLALVLVLAFRFGLESRLEPALLAVFWLPLVLIPLRAWANLRHGALLGLSRPVAGTMALSVTWALVLLPACLLWKALAPTPLDVQAAAWLAVAAWGLAFLIADRQMRARLRPAPDGPAADSRGWLGSALPMLLIVGMAILSLRADVLMLGALRGAREAGIYSMAASFAMLVRLGLVAVQPALAPRVVVARTRQELAQVARRAARVAFLLAVPVAAALLLGGSRALALYSPEFVDGTGALSVLACGFLLVTALGPVETILLMRNQQRFAAFAAVTAGALNLLLNALLIPRWGMEGAALATALSLLVWGLAMSLAVRRRLGFGASILARAAEGG